MDLTALWNFVKENGPVGAIILLLVLVVIWLIRTALDPVKSDALRAHVYGALHRLTGKRDHEKRYIANDINSRINRARRNLNFSSEAVPSAVSVEWVEDEGGRFYDVGDGQFVVCLDSRKCQEQNVVRLATAVVERTTLTGIRHLFSKPLAGAIDLNLVRDILIATKARHILDWFLSNNLVPALNTDATLKSWHDTIRETDERGLFTRVLLVELADFARRVQGLTPRGYMVGEIENLVRFVFRIATKPFGTDVPLSYITAHIKTGLLLVADTQKILSDGINPYVHAAQDHLGTGAESLYLISWDKPGLSEKSKSASKLFRARIDGLVRTLSRMNGMQIDGRHRYKTVDSFGNARDAICVRFYKSV